MKKADRRYAAGTAASLPSYDVLIGSHRSWPHSGHSNSPTTTSGFVASECIVRSCIGALASCRSHAGASS